MMTFFSCHLICRGPWDKTIKPVALSFFVKFGYALLMTSLGEASKQGRQQWLQHPYEVEVLAWFLVKITLHNRIFFFQLATLPNQKDTFHCTPAETLTVYSL